MMKAKIIWGTATLAVVIAAWCLVTRFVVARENDRTAQNVGNLIQIGLGCHLFAQDHERWFPHDWSELKQYLGEESAILFVRPENASRVGSMANVMEWTDYVYIPGATTTSQSGRVVAFLLPRRLSKGENVIVLFADNHVELQTVTQFTRTMNGSPNETAQITSPKGAESGR